MRAVIARGFNEDFGFPNTAGLAISPASLLEGEEGNLMVQVAALEAIRTGTTTIVEYTGNVQRQAAVLADSGLRCVLAEGIRDAENVPGPMSTRAMARAVSETPRFSARLRDEGMLRISDLFSTWHGARGGRVSVFPAAALTETSSPELLRAVREFAETHDLGNTIHLNQSRAEYEFMVMHHGLRPAAYLDRHDFLGPRLFAAHARYVNTEEVALLGRSGTIIAHQAGMAANRGISPPIPELRAAGCPIALGTDNNTNDVFEVMRIAMLTERIRRNRDGDEVPGLQPQPEDVLADCTQGGALAVQQPDALGTLEVGKKADLLVVDTLRAHLVPAGRVISALVHSGHPGDIESVMVDGRFVMRDREVLTMGRGRDHPGSGRGGPEDLGPGAGGESADCAAAAAVRVSLVPPLRGDGPGRLLAIGEPAQRAAATPESTRCLTEVLRDLRILAIGAMWIAGGLATALGPTGLRAQEVVDLPAGDSPLSADFEPVYRIGSAQAVAEWEEFFTVQGIGFDSAGEPVPAGWCGLRWRQASRCRGRFRTPCPRLRSRR